MFAPPLVLMGLAFAAGIAAATRLPPYLLPALGVGTAAILAGLLCYLKKWPGVVFALVTAFFICGAVFFWVQHSPGGLENMMDRRVQCRGVVAGEPDIREDRVYYRVLCQEINSGREETGAGSILLVRVPLLPGSGSAGGSGSEGAAGSTGDKSSSDGAGIYRYGDIISARGLLSFPERPGNPGQFDYGSYLLRRGIGGVLYVAVPGDVQRAGAGQGNIFLAMSLGLKEKLTAVTSKTITGENAALVNGLIFGARGSISPGTMEAFNQAGISHILSVSGMNVGFVLAGTLWLAGVAGLGQLARLPLLFLVLAAYWLMTGMGPAVSRATLMAVVLLLGKYLGRDTHWGASLVLAGMVILALNPSALLDPGFQLSFAATWGILYLGPYFAGHLAKVRGLPRGIGLLVGVSLGAQLATMPLTALYFNLLPVLSLPANILVVPLVGLMLPMGVFASLLGLLWLPGAALVNTATSVLADLLRLLAAAAVKLPGAYFYLPSPDLAWVAAFYLLLVIAVLPRHSRGSAGASAGGDFGGTAAGSSRDSARCSTGAGAGNTGEGILFRLFGFSVQKGYAVILLAAFLLGSGWSAQHPPGDNLEVHVIDVGQGESLLVKFPGGKVMLVDTGGRQGEFTLGRGSGDVVSAYLKGLGIGKIDTLVLTHPHEDHAGGAGAVLRAFKVRELVISPYVSGAAGGPGGTAADSGTAFGGGRNFPATAAAGPGKGEQGAEGYLRLLKNAAARGVPVWAAQRGHLLLDERGVTVSVLWPPGRIQEGTRSDSNNNSLVLSIRYGEISILLTGDIEVEAQEGLASSGNLPTARVLKVPHHGSGSITKDFVERISPGVAVISVGAKNSFGLPAAKTMDILEGSGCRIYRTDMDGAVILSSDGRQIKIFTGKR